MRLMGPTVRKAPRVPDGSRKRVSLRERCLLVANSFGPARCNSALGCVKNLGTVRTWEPAQVRAAQVDSWGLAAELVRLFR